VEKNIMDTKTLLAMDAKTLLENEYPLRATKLKESKFDDYDDYDTTEDMDDYEKDERKKSTPKKKISPEDMKKLVAKKFDKKTPAKKASKKKESIENSSMGGDVFAATSSEDFRTIANHFSRLGTQAADQLSSQIMDEVYKVLLGVYEEQGINAEEEAHSNGYETAKDMISETDDFEQFTTELAEAYIEGFDQAWFYPLS